MMQFLTYKHVLPKDAVPTYFMIQFCSLSKPFPHVGPLALFPKALHSLTLAFAAHPTVFEGERSFQEGCFVREVIDVLAALPK